MAVMTYLEAIADALRTEMKRDESVFMIGEDIGTYGGAFKLTKGFLNIGAAIGASLNGMRPVAEMQFMDFVTCGFNQLVSVAGTTAYRWGLGVPMVVRGPAGGGVGANPFHSRNSEAWFVQATGLKVVCPATPADAKGLLTASIRDNNPVIFFEHKGLYRKIKGEVPEGEYMIPLGKANVIVEGNDASIICYGSTVHMALEVAERMQKEGVSIEVVDIRTLVPFDEETVLRSVRKTNRVLITHEATLTGGFAGEISARITEKAFDSLDAPIKRVAAFDSPTPFAPTLEKAMLPNADKIHAELLNLLSY